MALQVASTINRSLLATLSSADRLAEGDTAVTGAAFVPSGLYKNFDVFKGANVTAFALLVQGSLDNINWRDLAASITSVGSTQIAQPWAYVRAKITSVTVTGKTITCTQAAGIATATCTAHGFVVGDRINITGANQAGYNQSPATVLTQADADHFTYAVDPATVTPSTGTITAKSQVSVWLGQ